MSGRWILRDADETERVGEALSKTLRQGDFVGLSGPLGAGKTCLTRGLLRGLRSTERVTSPTYTLMNHYSAPDPFDLVLHADLYRLEDMDDLASTGYWDAIEEAQLTLVEWIDKLPEAWPAEGFEIALDHAGDERVLMISWRGDAERGAERLSAAVGLVEAVLGA